MKKQSVKDKKKRRNKIKNLNPRDKKEKKIDNIEEMDKMVKNSSTKNSKIKTYFRIRTRFTITSFTT